MWSNIKSNSISWVFFKLCLCVLYDYHFLFTNLIVFNLHSLKTSQVSDQMKKNVNCNSNGQIQTSINRILLFFPFFLRKIHFFSFLLRWLHGSICVMELYSHRAWSLPHKHSYFKNGSSTTPIKVHFKITLTALLNLRI